MNRTIPLLKSTEPQLAYNVYLLVDPRTGETFYVGKGKRYRPFYHAKSHNKDVRERVNEIKSFGLEPILRFPIVNAPEDVALNIERTFIIFYRDTVLNKYKSGGRSPRVKRRPLTEAQKEKFRGRGRKLTIEIAQAIYNEASTTSMRDLANKFGVSSSLVGGILRGSHWPQIDRSVPLPHNREKMLHYKNTPRGNRHYARK